MLSFLTEIIKDKVWARGGRHKPKEMNMMIRWKSMLAVLALLSLVGVASAATQQSQSVTYFDAAGNAVGQRVLYCNGYQEGSGQQGGTGYYRLDEILCSAYEISGEACEDVQHIVDGGPVFGDTTYVCNPRVVEAKPGDLSSAYHLPPGMTLAQSCMRASCNPNLPQVTHLGSWSPTWHSIPVGTPWP